MNARGTGPKFGERRNHGLLLRRINIRMIAREPLKEGVHLRDDSITRPARFQARDRLEEGGAATVDDPRVDAQWNPEAGAAWKFDSGRHHSDHGVALTA